MLLPTTKKFQRRRGRPKPPPAPAGPPSYIVDVTSLDAVLTVVFDQPVTLDGLPAYTTALGPGVTPLSATQTAADTIEITFSGDLSGWGQVNFPFQDPAVRNAAGGYVTGNMFAHPGG